MAADFSHFCNFFDLFDIEYNFISDLEGEATVVGHENTLHNGRLGGLERKAIKDIRTVLEVGYVHFYFDDSGKYIGLASFASGEDTFELRENK